MIQKSTSPTIGKCLGCAMLLFVWGFVASTADAQEMNSTQIIEAAIRHQNLGWHILKSHSLQKRLRRLLH